MDPSGTTTEALDILNTCHGQFIALLLETLDAAEDGIQALEVLQVGMHFAQSSVAILAALKRCTPDVRARLRQMAPQTRFVYDAGAAA